MSFFYDLFGAHTPKKQLILHIVCLGISIYFLVDALLNDDPFIWVAYLVITSALCAYAVLDKYYEIRYEKMKVF